MTLIIFGDRIHDPARGFVCAIINGLRIAPRCKKSGGAQLGAMLGKRRSLVLDERTKLVARKITEFLKQSGDRFQKTIVFCVDQEHAGRMRQALVNENSDLVAENHRYVMRITANDPEGVAQVDSFIDPQSKYPVLVTTSRLLSTGVDVQTCRLIVLDHDRLTAASLARLNAPDPDTFRDDARFALDALPALTARPDQIKQLRQTILNLAVRGKLVSQDPNDEAASELLKRIADEITSYSKKNGLSQTRAEAISNDDVPYPLPQGWRWSRLCSLFKVITDGDHQPPPRSDEGIAFLTIGNITTGQLDFSGCRLVPRQYFESLAAYRIPSKGDILYTVVGATYGRPALVETDRSFCVQRHIAILKPSEAMNLRFLVWLLASPLIYDQATRSTTGTAQPTIALRPLRNLIAPVPPLAEQRRIVTTVDELMALCDRLEGSLITAADLRRRLLDALLAEALAPNAERELEAAE